MMADNNFLIEATILAGSGDRVAAMYELILMGKGYTGPEWNAVGAPFYENGAIVSVVYRPKTGDEVATCGLVVHLDETENLSYYSGPGAVPMGIYDYSDGKANTDNIKSRQNWENDYPAAAWCAAKGNEWFLPAIDELSELNDRWQEDAGFNDKIISFGGEEIAETTYWSSTKDTNLSFPPLPYVWRWDFNLKNRTFVFATSNNRVRAVRSF